MNKALKNIENNILPNVCNLENKDIVMAIIALQHLKNERTFLVNADLGVGLLTAIPTFVVDMTTLIQTTLFTVAGCTGVKFVYDCFAMRKINKLMLLFIDELMNKFETPQMAYIELSSMIMNVTRDEIIDYLNSIGCEHNFVK